jgi:pSer/pThr/pTyr-binding forkhead associated (FHA) protein
LACCNACGHDLTIAPILNKPSTPPSFARTPSAFNMPATKVPARKVPLVVGPTRSARQKTAHHGQWDGAPSGEEVQNEPGTPEGTIEKTVPLHLRPQAPNLELVVGDGRSVAEPTVSSPKLQSPSNQSEKSNTTVTSTPKKPPSYAHLTQEELMDQARNYLCWQCYTPIPKNHKFCGRCGAEVPAEILEMQTVFFSEMQNPAKARLILIRGEGMDGLSFHLKMEKHLVGRKGQIEFPDDPFVSPTHANFFYRNGKLFARDEGSLNGVFLRVRGSTDIAPGDTFLAGEQVFRLDPTPRASDAPDQEGTFFYTSPKHPSPFRITQILQGGALGMTVCARSNALQLGREGGDLNFPSDIYMSGSHCRIEMADGKFTLTDLNSRNGTYIRMKTERELGHGDYLFIGRKLLRVELNS